MDPTAGPGTTHLGKRPPRGHGARLAGSGRALATHRPFEGDRRRWPAALRGRHRRRGATHVLRRYATCAAPHRGPGPRRGRRRRRSIRLPWAEPVLEVRRAGRSGTLARRDGPPGRPGGLTAGGRTADPGAPRDASPRAGGRGPRDGAPCRTRADGWGLRVRIVAANRARFVRTGDAYVPSVGSARNAGPRGDSMTRTFLLLQLDSEGAPYSEVADLLEDLGFRPETEGYDFLYDWGRPATLRETLDFADRIQEALRGKRVGFRIESTEE